MRLVILGGTGSGKGTQTYQLSSKLAIPDISVGNILQTNIVQKSDLGLKSKEYVEKGKLVPDELIIELIKARLLEFDVKNGWILEGYPRTAFQAEELDFLLQHLKQRLDCAIYLQVSEAVMIQRALARGLEHDTSEIVKNRLKNFYQSTVPILEYYAYNDRLLTINGEQSPEKVAQDIAAQLKS